MRHVALSAGSISVVPAGSPATRPRWSRIVTEAQLMPEEEPIHASPIGPLDWLKAIPFEPAAWSDRLGWVGLKAARYYAMPAFVFHPPALTHPMFMPYARPPEQPELGSVAVDHHT